MDNISSKFCNELGYINCIQVCNRVPGIDHLEEAAFDLALACELGLYFGTVSSSGEFTLVPKDTESYFQGLTVTQVIEI